MKAKQFHWRSQLSIKHVASCIVLLGIVSCVDYGDNPVVEDNHRDYPAEVYYYLNKANERENPSEEERAVYEAKEWRMESKNTTVTLPQNFRWCGGEFNANGLNEELPDPTYLPTTQGLNTLMISGSARFSDKELKALTSWVTHQVGDIPRYVIDLRQESHGFINGHHVSWYGYITWANIGKKRDQILQEEEQLFHSLKGQTITVGKISSSNNYVMTDAQDITVDVDSAWTESEAVKKQGWGYRRITALDHVFPCDEIIDQFLECYRSLPRDAWVHFHCQAGRGRTTTFMSFFDMLRNPDVPLKDILYRQTELGGTSLYYQGTRPTEQPWRVDLFTETSWLVPLLYDYVQDNKGNGYTISWTDWKKRTFQL